MDSKHGIQRGWRLMEEFVACFAGVVDRRQENIRHDLHEVLMIALCTMLCGGEDCSELALFGEAKEPFLRQFLRLRHGIPSDDTFSRLFRWLDPVRFQACFVRFMERFAETMAGVVAIDGKTLRRSFDRAAGKSPLHMVHPWAADQRLLLGQIAVDDKSNEITAVPKLLEMLSLQGCIVTADAINCQRAIGAKVTERGGDYVLALNGNQGTMNEDQARHCKDHGPENIALLRRPALNLAKLEGSKGSIKGKLKRAGCDDTFLSSLLAQFAKSHMR